MDKLLLVEDDLGIVDLLRLHLANPRFELTISNNGYDAFKQIENQNFNLIILDLMLPDIDGMEICKRIRLVDMKIPILILTAKSDEFDKVLALELGADDYLTKPFGVKELMARIKALLRRTKGNSQELHTNKSILNYNQLTIDPFKRKADIANNRIELTPKEFDLLLLLARNPGKSFSREELLNQIWGYSFKGYEHTVTAHINRLRLKIEPEISKPFYILTTWGIGYRFTEN